MVSCLLPCSSRTLTPDDRGTEYLPPSICVNSFIRSPIDIPRSPSMRPHYASWINGSQQRLPFTTSKSLLRLLPSWNVSSHLYARFLYHHEFDLVTAFHGWFNPLPMFLPLARNRARSTFRYTRATWMRLVMISLGQRVLACNFETYRYSLPLLTCRSFSACTYTISSSLWPRTTPHEVNHHYIPPYIQLILHLSLYLSIDHSE